MIKVTIRRVTLRYELWDPEVRRWVIKFKSINQSKERKGVPLSEQEIWEKAGEEVTK